MLNKTYRWSRPNEEVVKFRGFSKDELTQIYPALAQTDKYLSDKKRLNASFVKAKPIVGRLPARAAAETRYSPLFGKAKVYVNPQVFNDNRYQWEPSGVVSHEIGHLIGPARRGNSNPRERREFRKAFSYRQKKVVHEYAPQLWAQTVHYKVLRLDSLRMQQKILQRRGGI